MKELNKTYAASRLWRRNGLIWFALLVLLLTTFGSAYLRLGAWNTFIGIAIAFLKAGLVAMLFMELSRSDPARGCPGPHLSFHPFWTDDGRRLDAAHRALTEPVPGASGTRAEAPSVRFGLGCLPGREGTSRRGERSNACFAQI
jgi:Prokaryotic Cytochrome C oxidase subunit IV